MQRTNTVSIHFVNSKYPEYQEIWEVALLLYVTSIM